jgi:hypothetical protein
MPVRLHSPLNLRHRSSTNGFVADAATTCVYRSAVPTSVLPHHPRPPGLHRRLGFGDLYVGVPLCGLGGDVAEKLGDQFSAQRPSLHRSSRMYDERRGMRWALSRPRVRACDTSD